jgi:phosphinothricin acetyltransferase
VEIRLARTDDAAAIAEIYNREVTESTVTFDLEPRSVEAQRRWLAERSGAHAVVVAVDEAGALMGFASLSPYKERPAYRTSVEDSVYIHRDHHGQGVGKALLADLVDRAREHGFHTVIARMVGGHDASIALHRAVGFVEVGYEREVGRKFGKWLDVVTMQVIL